MNDILTASFFIGLLSATLRMATPLIIATLGEVFCERSGVLNLGIEGIMLFCSLVAFLTAYFTHNLWLGVLFAILVGILFGILMAFFTVNLGVSQHVSGLGITIFASGLSLFTYRQIIGSPQIPPTIETFKTFAIPFLSKIPFIGPILFDQYILTYIALILVPIVSFVIYKTNFGLSLRAVGENPEAADAVGINVYKTRYIALIIGGALMGLAGSFFTLAYFNMFLYGIVGGRGYVCIALVIFANWDPTKVLLGSLLFGGVDALQLRLQAIGFNIPYQFFLMMPYVLTIVVLILVARNAIAPSALLKPYRRE
ncbi:MAG TPA: ABC transporter permease [Caldisericia bacterium]|nr:ABC transporter permease [Caldisericia bacterium]HON83475.1 ABC transporter permease [Caldisericia bacterium]HPP43377.1 ABC transporter permease [Caldisericia bacterium]